MNVTVVGCGVRGSVAAALLAGAGVEELSLVDEALVEESDVGVHPLQFSPDVGSGKADALVAKLALINSRVHAQAFPANLSAENATAILIGASCVLDCASSGEVSGWIADAAEQLEIPVIGPSDSYDAAASSAAAAAAIGATQADQALTLRS